MLLPYKPEYERDNQGDQDAGGDGEEYGKILFLHIDVTREFAQPGKLAGEHQQDACRSDYTSQNDK